MLSISVAKKGRQRITRPSGKLAEPKPIVFVTVELVRERTEPVIYHLFSKTLSVYVQSQRFNSFGGAINPQRYPAVCANRSILYMWSSVLNGLTSHTQLRKPLKRR